MDRKTVLSEYIKNEIIRNSNAKLDENEDLLGTGVLDSLSILRIVAFVEESFSIQVPDEDVVYENFKSVSALEEYLNQHNK